MHHTGPNRISQHRTVGKTAAYPSDHTLAPMTVTETEYTSQAHCRDCDWDQNGGTIGAIKHHVLRNPGHQITARWAATETFTKQ